MKRRVYWSQNCHHPLLKSQGLALDVDDEFKSQPCKTIHHTYGDRIEELRCCELPKSVQTHSIMVEKGARANPTLTPPVTETHVVVTIIEHIYQSQPSPTIQYTYDETLEGLRCCDIHKSIKTYSILV